MKPIPSGFCEAADNAPVPGRPWWRQEGDRLWRCDRRFVSAIDDDWPAQVERIDAEHPLPHPGYRAGQVWLWDAPEGAWVAEGRKLGIPQHAHVRFRTFTITGMYGTVPIVASGRESGSPAISGMPDCYLLFDPLMPAKAPWSPK